MFTFLLSFPLMFHKFHQHFYQLLFYLYSHCNFIHRFLQSSAVWSVYGYHDQNPYLPALHHQTYVLDHEVSSSLRLTNAYFKCIYKAIFIKVFLSEVQGNLGVAECMQQEKFGSRKKMTKKGTRNERIEDDKTVG